MKSYKGIIFDLDGVICTTDSYHYKAWKKIADRLNIPFSEADNSRLRGVSRRESLEIILGRYSGQPLTDSEKEQLCDVKNDIYRESLQQLSSADINETVVETLNQLKALGYQLAIGSSSRNTEMILKKLGLFEQFDAISDGTKITHSKPHPEVFLLAADLLGVKPQECLVVEDAISGVEAGHAGGFKVACVGDASQKEAGDFNLKRLLDLLKVIE